MEQEKPKTQSLPGSEFLYFEAANRLLKILIKSYAKKIAKVIELHKDKIQHEKEVYFFFIKVLIGNIFGLLKQ